MFRLTCDVKLDNFVWRIRVFSAVTSWCKDVVILAATVARGAGSWRHSGARARWLVQRVVVVGLARAFKTASEKEMVLLML